MKTIGSEAKRAKPSSINALLGIHVSPHFRGANPQTVSLPKYCCHNGTKSRNRAFLHFIFCSSPFPFLKKKKKRAGGLFHHGEAWVKAHTPRAGCLYPRAVESKGHRSLTSWIGIHVPMRKKQFGGQIRVADF